MNNLFFIPEDYEQAIGKAFYSNWSPLTNSALATLVV